MNEIDPNLVSFEFEGQDRTGQEETTDSAPITRFIYQDGQKKVCPRLPELTPTAMWWDTTT